MKVLLVGRHQAIEPLGIQHLAGVARDVGWERDVVLVKDGDFTPAIERARETRPELVAFSIWTGFHLQSFAAMDAIRAMGLRVACGGPHATWFQDSCVPHADFISRGDGFRTFQRILNGEAEPGIIFDETRLAVGFPMPDRASIYDRYPDLAASPIKSMMLSVGCPYACHYCWAPAFNKLYGGFQLDCRDIDNVISEAREIQTRWPAKMIYLQDDVMGFDLRWLEVLAERWPAEVGIPWHCQIRLEMTRDERRLDLFVRGGCTGITLAIESGNDFLRRYVLNRAMPDELIVEGCKRITDRGLTLRTEQILAVPFSDLDTDLATLELNCRINPEMAWTSILSPFLGTPIGDVSKAFRMYEKNNDDLSETFFDRSVLRHVEGGWSVVQPIVEMTSINSKDNPLLRAKYLEKSAEGTHFGIDGRRVTINYLTPEANDIYCDQTVLLQRLFYWLSRLPAGDQLGRRFVTLRKRLRTWQQLGALAREHLLALGYPTELLASWLDATMASIEDPDHHVLDNWLYFAWMPSGPELARKCLDAKVWDLADPLAKIGTMTRHHLFERALYKIVPADPPIARRI